MNRRSLPLAMTALIGLFNAGTLTAQSISITDCIQPIAPGLTVRAVREEPRDPAGANCSPDAGPWECSPEGGTVTGAALWTSAGTDAAGNTYVLAGDASAPASYWHLQRINETGATEEVAQITRVLCTDVNCQIGKSCTLGPLNLDVTNGRIVIPVLAELFDVVGAYELKMGIVELSGLPTMFDTLLTFVPGGTLAALTPAHPDGFRVADSLQVWTGNVRAMPDWSQAQPLACLAATAPAPGQVVTVADTLPDPPVGEGRYYLMASQSGPNRRLGRAYINGAVVARDPVGLPVCQ